MSDELSEVRCAECSELVAFTGSQPYGYIICPGCNEKRQETPASMPVT